MGLFRASDDDTRIPVAVLTGFLGSGKTTLLNRLLQHSEMSNSAVVINEIGEVGLDQYFLDEADSDVVMLSNGCLCCIVRDDFEATVSRIYARRGSADLPAFQRLVIETTGLADPAPVIEGFLSNPVLSRCFRLASVVVTVDAFHGERHFDQYFEAIRQVAVADQLVLTKTNMVDAKALMRIKDRLRLINHGADIRNAGDDEIGPDLLFGPGLFDRSGNRLNVDVWMGQHAEPTIAPQHGHHAHEERISAFTLVIDRPLDWPSFSEWLRKLRIQRGDNLLRIKGVLNVEGEARPIALHGVHHVLHVPTTLRAWPWEDRRSRIVFVTCDLDKKEIEASLSALLLRDRSAAAPNAPTEACAPKLGHRL